MICHPLCPMSIHGHLCHHHFGHLPLPSLSLPPPCPSSSPTTSSPFLYSTFHWSVGCACPCILNTSQPIPPCLPPYTSPSPRISSPYLFDTAQPFIGLLDVSVHEHICRQRFGHFPLPLQSLSWPPPYPHPLLEYHLLTCLIQLNLSLVCSMYLSMNISVVSILDTSPSPSNPSSSPSLPLTLSYNISSFYLLDTDQPFIGL